MHADILVCLLLTAVLSVLQYHCFAWRASCLQKNTFLPSVTDPGLALYSGSSFGYSRRRAAVCDCTCRLAVTASYVDSDHWSQIHSLIFFYYTAQQHPNLFPRQCTLITKINSFRHWQNLCDLCELTIWTVKQWAVDEFVSQWVYLYVMQIDSFMTQFFFTHPWTDMFFATLLPGRLHSGKYMILYYLWFWVLWSCDNSYQLLLSVVL